jgi:hypothetical protein
VRLLGFALVVASSAFGQVVVDPARIPGLLKNLEPREGERILRCEVNPTKPLLNFSFRFQPGFILHVPLNQYSGRRHRWTMLLEVSPAGGKPVYLVNVIRLPEIPEKTRVVAEAGGGFLVGEGRYDVQWILADDAGRVCRKAWSFNAHLRHSERAVRVAMAPGTVSGFTWFTPAGGARDADDVRPIRLTVLLHAAPVSLRRTTLRASDSVLLVSLLSSLLERLRATAVRLVVFNLDQQKELFRQDVFTPRTLGQVMQSINEVQLGVVDYSVLKNRRGHLDLLTDMVNRELQAKEPSDVVLFLGPAARYGDKVPPEALETVADAGPQFYYLQYRPFFRTTSNFPDVIALALRKLRGRTVTIHTPGEFAKAIQQVEQRVAERP